ncbi:MAG TPA: alpha/beta hydrolase [Phycisphaerales bacterium]|nr:alpha/beta hydrolase [Phycisphaerales bacterium]
MFKISYNKFKEHFGMWLSISLVLLVAYSILGWSLYFLQSSFVYKPTKNLLYNPGDLNLTYEKVVLKTEDGLKLSAWFIPAENARQTILFCHGNAGNISHRLDTANIFNELGVNCLLFDYRGYGNSQGKPTEEGTYLDAEAAWNWLIKRGIGPEQIIIFGRSLGGSIASHLAAKVHPSGLVLESNFTSYVDMGKKFYPYMPIRLFARFNYNAIDHIRKIDCPLLIIHSRNDEVIPFEFGLKLYDAAKEPKEFLEIFGSHNDGFLYSGQVYRETWTKWLGFVRKQNRSASSKVKIIS